MEYVQANAIVLADVPSGQMRVTYNAFHQAHFARITPLLQVIDRKFYWIEGAYRLTLELLTDRPVKRFPFTYNFSLSDAESQSLRLNAEGCLLAVCNVPDLVWNFAYPAY